MKKALYILAIASFLGITGLKAQAPLATLEHNGTTSVFYGNGAFTSAYTAATSGDTIVLSTGSFNTNDWYLTKTLTIIGSGIYSDSVTMNTSFNQSLYFSPESQNSTIEGVACGYVYINASNLKFNRCSMNSTINFSSEGTTNTLINGCVFTGNSINFNSINTTNVTIKNTLFISNSPYLNNGTGVYFEHNTFVNNYYWGLFSYMVGSYFKNNVFYLNNAATALINSINSSTFEGNLFSETNNSGASLSNSNYQGNTYLTNYYPVNQGSVFSSIVNGDIYTFSWKNNYHLSTPSSYLGTDATEDGIYGGTTPFKYKATPSNPQIVSKTIAGQTDQNGNLPVNIKAKASNY